MCTCVILTKKYKAESDSEINWIAFFISDCKEETKYAFSGQQKDRSIPCKINKKLWRETKVQ